MAPTETQIRLSVIIASHNRSERLRRCLAALDKQSLDPSRFEVIVADDGSSDGTAAMVAAYGASYRLTALQLENGGKAAALNVGIETAVGSVCLFIDDDVLASEHLLAAHLQAYEADPLTLGIGPLIQAPPADGDWFGVAHAAAWNERYKVLGRKEADWRDCYGGNFSAPRQALNEVDGFDTDLEAIEDIEIGHRLSAIGCRPTYLPGAEAVHDDEKPRAKLIADAEGYGTFCAEFAERIPATRPQLIGWFLATTPRDVTLRRALLAMRTPPRLLAALGAAIPGNSRKQFWFSFVSRYVFWRGVRRGMSRRRWLQTTRGVPVLMYHGFGAAEEGDRFVVSRRRLRWQLRTLAALRYKVIGFEELAGTLGRGEAPSPRCVVLTVDDGYADNLELARPLLLDAGAPATFFLVSRRLGAGNDWTPDGALAGRPLLSEEEARRLRGPEISIGAHTRTHPVLPRIDAGQAATEIAGSRSDLEALLGEPVTAFAYPYGEVDATIRAAVADAGFDAACTVEPRPARLGDDPLLIPRIEVWGGDSLSRFVRKLWFGWS